MTKTTQSHTALVVCLDAGHYGKYDRSLKETLEARHLRRKAARREQGKDQFQPIGGYGSDRPNIAENGIQHVK